MVSGAGAVPKNPTHAESERSAHLWPDAQRRRSGSRLLVRRWALRSGPRGISRCIADAEAADEPPPPE